MNSNHDTQTNEQQSDTTQTFDVRTCHERTQLSYIVANARSDASKA